MQELAWFGWGSIWAFSVASSGDDPSSSADLRVVITITELGFLSPSADSIHTCCCLVSLLCLLDFMFQFSTSYISLLWSVNCSNWLLIDSPLTTAQIPERLHIQDEEEEVLELLLQPHWNPTAVTHPLPQFASPVPAALFTHLACLHTCWLACSPSTANYTCPLLNSFFLLRTLQQIDRFLSCPATNDDTEKCVHRLHTTSARNLPMMGKSVKRRPGSRSRMP